MSLTMTRRAGAELPDITLEWTDTDGDIINFSSGHTFSVVVTPVGSSTATFTLTSGITGATTLPNITIAATSADFGALAVGRYTMSVTAIRSADSKDRKFPAVLLTITD